MTYRTANLQSCILYIYLINIGTEYFKHGVYSPFFFSSKCSLFHNSNLFGSCIIHILYTGWAKIKKNNSGAKGLTGHSDVVLLQTVLCSVTNRVVLVPKINYLIYLLTAVGLTPGGSGTVHIYTKTEHRTTQLTTVAGRLSEIRTQSCQTKINDELTV